MSDVELAILCGELMACARRGEKGCARLISDAVHAELERRYGPTLAWADWPEVEAAGDG